MNITRIIIALILISPCVASLITTHQISGDSLSWENEVNLDDVPFIDKYIIVVSIFGSFFTGIVLIFSEIRDWMAVRHMRKMDREYAKKLEEIGELRKIEKEIRDREEKNGRSS